MHKYEIIAEKIEKLISDGVLRPGSKLPSIRAICRQERISLATANSAYMLLERQGRIEARERSGFYVRSRVLDHIPEPRTVNVSIKKIPVTIPEMISEICTDNFGSGGIALGTACPGRKLLDLPALRKIGAAVAREEKDPFSTYDKPPGHPRLRAEIVRRMAGVGISAHPNEVVTVHGAAQALTLCLQATTRPGDAVVVESPTFFIIFQLLELLGLQAIEIPTSSRTGIDLNLLKRALKQYRVSAMVLTGSFHNPTGGTIPEDEKKSLARLAAQHGVAIIEDDVYGELPHLQPRPRPIKAFDDKGHVLYCSSFSKTLGPGHRIGWIVPGRFQSEVERMKLITSVATASHPQAVLARYLAEGTYDRHLRRLSGIFSAQVARGSELVAKTFPSGTKISRPSGGFLLWIELPKSISSIELYRRLQKRGISISPGPLFSTTQRFGSFLRLNCGLDWDPKVERAIATIAEVAKGLA